MVNIVIHRVNVDTESNGDTDSEQSEVTEVLQDADPEIIHSCFGDLLPKNPRDTTVLPLSKKMIKSFGAVTKIKKSGKKNSKHLDKFLSEMSREKPTRFSLKQLKSFTQNFTSKIGMGGFGTVYKGVMPNNVQVAIKMLLGVHKEEQFMAEVSILGRTYHRNIVRLFGFCTEGDVIAVVYEYVENGSLYRNLCHEPHRIAWDMLYKISIETAKGISYLHEDCQEVMIHLDIKSANILLDSNFSPKLADFGCAVLFDRDTADDIYIELRGTVGYLAPEFIMSGCATSKCDVYSFGVVLFDILRRRGKVYDPESMDIQWFQKLVSVVWNEFEKGNLETFLASQGVEELYRDQVWRLSMVALWCVQERPEDRPSMSTVVSILKGDVAVMMPPNPFADRYSYATTSRASDDTGGEEIIETNDQDSNSIVENNSNLFTSIMDDREIETATSLENPTMDFKRTNPINDIESTSEIVYNAWAQRKMHHNNMALPSKYIKSFPSKFIPYIQHLKDVKGDGNCGYRAVADLLGMTENGWASVREDLSYELQLHWEEYTRLFEEYGSINRLMNSLEFYDINAPLDYWMDMPDMGHVIASCYNVVLVHTSLKQCLTFLPLRSPSLPAELHQIISVGFVNGNHFVRLDLEQGCPIPRIAERWYRCCHPCAKEWEQPYTSRIKHFEELVRGENVALRETPIEVT